MKKIQNVGAKIDGIVINDLDTSKDSYYNYNYNYNYSSSYYNSKKLMFNLKKFSTNDSVYINLSVFWKAFSLLINISLFSILEFNSIFDLVNLNIYMLTKYFYFSFYFTASYLIFSFIVGTIKKNMKQIL